MNAENAAMGTRELQQKYEASTTKQAINHAIRAEIPGGTEALDSLDQLVKRLRTTGSDDAAIAVERVKAIVSAMEADVRGRYGLPVI